MHVLSLAITVATLLLGATDAPSLPTSVVEEIGQTMAAWDTEGAKALIDDARILAPTHPLLDVLEAKRLFYEGQYTAAKALVATIPDPWRSESVEDLEALVQASVTAQLGHVTIPSEGGAFSITYDPTLDTPTALLAVTYLEQIREAVGAVFGVYPSSPVRIEILPEATDLAAMSHLTDEEIQTTGTIALCSYNKIMITSPRLLVYGYPWVDTLAHEYIHYILTKATADHMDVWLQEGLAKYFEGTWKGKGGGDIPRYMRVLLADSAKKKQLVDLEAMSPSLAKLPDQRSSALAYAESASIVELLVLQEGMDAVPTLVTQIGLGKSTRKVIEGLIGIPFKNFLVVWQKHIKKLSFKKRETQLYPILLFKTKELKDELPLESAIDVTKVLDHVHLGDLLFLRDEHAAAAVEYATARTTFGIPAPDLAAKEAMALLEQGDAKATASLLEAFSVDFPNHFLVRVLYGEALVSLGAFDDARAQLEAALTINPYDPSIYASLAKVYEAQGDDDALARVQAIAVTVP